MRNFTFVFISCLFFFFSQRDLQAAHVNGGWMTYKHVSDTEFEFTVQLIRDRLGGGAEFDQELFVQIYTLDDNEYSFVQTLVVELGSTYAPNFGFDTDQIESVLGIANEIGEYNFNFDLVEENVDYYLVYQRCCRSQTFSNINTPGEIGISIGTTVTREAIAAGNSSISFNSIPSLFATIGQDNHFPVDAMDADGDEIRYSFSPTFIGGGLDGSNGPGDPQSCTGVIPFGPCSPPYHAVPYVNPLSVENPFPGWSSQGMDPEDGRLLGTPDLIGQYAYGFKVEEIRNGEIINTTVVDIVIYIITDNLSSNLELNEVQFKISPNPSQNSVAISSQQYSFNTIDIFNVHGQRVQNEKFTGRNDFAISINLTNGLYLMKIETENGYVMKKMVVQN